MYKSKFQKSQIEKAKLMLEEISRKENQENLKNQEKSLYEVSLYEMILRVQQDLINILIILFNENLELKAKILKLNDYKVSIGIFMIFISLCIFLSAN